MEGSDAESISILVSMRITKKIWVERDPIRSTRSWKCSPDDHSTTFPRLSIHFSQHFHRGARCAEFDERISFRPTLSHLRHVNIFNARIGREKLHKHLFVNSEIKIRNPQLCTGVRNVIHHFPSRLFDISRE